MTEHFDRFVQDGIASGRFSDASEVVREGLRLLEQRERQDEAKIEWLRSATSGAINSIERGAGVEFETVDDLATYVHQVGKEASAEIAAERRRG